jgi:hypothetical protein
MTALDTDRIRDIVADRIELVVAAIAVGTLGAGLFQLVFPGVVLDIIDGDSSTTPAHFFAIVGMFMALFGGLVLHSLYRDEAVALVVGWAAVQKLGASIAVGVGVARDVFGALALAVALFDLVSFFVMAALARREAVGSPTTTPSPTRHERPAT